MNRAEAARELLIRKAARADILRYVSAIDVPGKPAGEDPDAEVFAPVESAVAHHHRLILQEAVATTQRPHGRLMIFCPPGSAKSTYASVVMPSYYLGGQPNRRLILATYGDDLARKMGRRTRSIIKQLRYSGIFGSGLTHESQAAQEFALTNGSEYMACGILAGVTGNRAHGIIIDDPIKGREQANSEVVRQKAWDAYEDDLKTRLIPGGFIIIIQTRWHEDDLSGRILPAGWNGQSGDIECRDGNTWRVLCIQARCEVETDPLGRAQGEYLWPEWFDRKHWSQFESNPRTWNAMYQQRPSPLDGEIFKPDQIGVLDALPAEDIKWCRGWDLASVEGGGDWTVGTKIGRRPNGRLIIADVARKQYGSDKRDALMKNTSDLDGRNVKISIPQDPGQAGKTQVLYLSRLLVGHRVVFSPESGDKITRAEPLASQVNVGNVDLVRGDWNRVVLDEMRSFPNGAHDDCIDAMSRAFSELIAPRRSFFG